MVRSAVDEETTSRPDYFGPAIWKDMSEAAQRKETQKWAIEKPNLGNAGRMRGIHFIEPADEDFKKTVRNEWRKLEVPMPGGNALQDQGKNVQGTCHNLDAPKTKYACIVEADASTRKRLEGTLHTDHEDHIARNQFIKPLQSCVQIHSDA